MCSLEREAPPFANGFEEEFRTLHDEDRATVTVDDFSIAAQNPEYNRYIDVLPFNKTRVKLQNCYHDYINAVGRFQIHQY